jgi:hypothetical protein
MLIRRAEQIIRQRIAQDISTCRPSSLSDLGLSYCGKAGFGHFLRSFSWNRMTIRLKRAQKLPQTGLSLATDA